MRREYVEDKSYVTNGKRSKRKKRRKKIKLITICCSFVLVCIISILAYNILRINNIKETQKMKNKNISNNTVNKIYKNKDKHEDIKSHKDVKVLAGSNLDNSGYIPLNEDPNAEDAKMVFNNTEGLLKQQLTYPVRTDGKKVAYLTFDDGPSTENTQNILDILNKYGIKATFFVTGVSIEHNDESKRLLKEIVQSGNAIGNHTYSHNYKTLYPGGIIDSNTFMDEIKRTEEIMKSVLGKDFHTRVIRFPGGYWSWNGRSNIRPILDKEGYVFINWNVLNEDAQGAPKNSQKLFEVLTNYVEGLGENADSIVVLMHDTYGKSETVKALPKVIEYFKNKGFEFKSIK